MIKGMHHIAICVKDLKASMEFYHDILGFEVTRGVPGDDMDAFYVQIPGSGELEFVERHGSQVSDPIDPNHTCLHHFALEVDDPAPYYELLKEKGYEFEIPLGRLDQFGHYTCGVLDPDGIMVEFICDYETPEREDSRRIDISKYI